MAKEAQRARQDERHGQLLRELEQGISGLTSSSEWQRYLETQSRFHRYSFGNVVLISVQRPDATRVAGYQSWRGMGRSVKKGEKAIYILAPLVTRQEPARPVVSGASGRNKVLSAGAPAAGAPAAGAPAGGKPPRGGNARAGAIDPGGAIDPAEAGEHGKDERGAARVVRGFRLVPVFDIAQTEGDALVEVSTRLVGEAPQRMLEVLAGLAGAIGFEVVEEKLAGGTNGDCSHQLKRIRVEVRNDPLQRAKTLAHELAHAILHESFTDRALAELEAESTAYVVCRALGAEAGAYSFGYVAGWAGGGSAAIAGIKASCARVQATASRLLEPFEERGLLVAPGAVRGMAAA